MSGESKLLTNINYLVCLNSFHFVGNPEYDFIIGHFCGQVVNSPENILPCTLVYLIGDIEASIGNFQSNRVFAISEFSSNYIDNSEKYQVINVGQVPLNTHGVGVFFRNLFDTNINYFSSISNEHEFQTLTESNKPSPAFRKGIYLTNVTQLDSDDSIKFNLLRCSTNLDGPTDNLRQTDTDVLAQLNQMAPWFFTNPADLNHVLAQIYTNTKTGGENHNMERKAKIKDHSDKTKDMPLNGLMAFCSFYENYSNGNFHDSRLVKENVRKSKSDPFDWVCNESSVLTRLRFRLKSEVTDTQYVKQFDIVLYPNSVFLMSLETNRLYTHEIIPSGLPVDKLPTRMGYVVRCSNTQAVHKDGCTWLIENGHLIKLQEPNESSVSELRKLYFKENTSAEPVNYGPVHFSMNLGDYQAPNL